MRRWSNGSRAKADGKPCYGQLTVSYARDEQQAQRTAFECWPNAAITGDLGQELPLPAHFEQAASMVSEADVAETVVCGPDPELHLSKITEFAEAGFDHVSSTRSAPDQDGFFSFYEREILPAFVPAPPADWPRPQDRTELACR
jgi:coenzyme F420-dependent glucose-6-phosphate dehydrogenase